MKWKYDQGGQTLPMWAGFENNIIIIQSFFQDGNGYLWDQPESSPPAHESGLPTSLRGRARFPTHGSPVDWGVSVRDRWTMPSSPGVAMAGLGLKEESNAGEDTMTRRHARHKSYCRSLRGQQLDGDDLQLQSHNWILGRAASAFGDSSSGPPGPSQAPGGPEAGEPPTTNGGSSRVKKSHCTNPPYHLSTGIPKDSFWLCPAQLRGVLELVEEVGLLPVKGF